VISLGGRSQPHNPLQHRASDKLIIHRERTCNCSAHSSTGLLMSCRQCCALRSGRALRRHHQSIQVVSAPEPQAEPASPLLASAYQQVGRPVRSVGRHAPGTDDLPLIRHFASEVARLCRPRPRLCCSGLPTARLRLRGRGYSLSAILDAVWPRMRESSNGRLPATSAPVGVTLVLNRCGPKVTP
jgi:hypothetical protein